MKADVAQLVEQSIRNRQVIGSSPIVGSIVSVAPLQHRLEFPFRPTRSFDAPVAAGSARKSAWPATPVDATYAHSRPAPGPYERFHIEPGLRRVFHTCSPLCACYLLTTLAIMPL